MSQGVLFFLTLCLFFQAQAQNINFSIAPQCSNIFANDSNVGKKKSPISLQANGVDYTYFPRIAKILNKIQQNNGLSPLQLQYIVRIVAKEEMDQATPGYFAKKVNTLKQKFSTDSQLQAYLVEQISLYGLTEAFKHWSLYREPSSLERFRLFVDRTNLMPLIGEVAGYTLAAWMTGPLSLWSLLTLPPKSIAWLRTKPVPPELLERGLKEGFESVRPELQRMYSSRAQYEVVKNYVQQVTATAFFLIAAFYVNEQKDWVFFAARMVMFPTTESSLRETERSVGIDFRVERQLQGWIDAYPIAHPKAQPTTEEINIKRAELKKILSRK